jgi:hypothetical protein
MMMEANSITITQSLCHYSDSGSNAEIAINSNKLGIQIQMSNLDVS